ncbi:MAG TPA: amino acid adenylation domain-containing protein, partial [Longimicrobium sp.]|nr:amino acid adenylation domain-containing protein [Longimicrobium sp.]
MTSIQTIVDRQEILRLARAAKLERRSSELPPIVAAGPGERRVLSFAQQRLWFLEQLGGSGATYHMRRRLRLRGGLDRAALAGALARIVARHEALRTSFPMVDGEPEQHVAPVETGFVLADHDLGADAFPEAALRRLMTEEGDAPFDLARGPLLRARLVRMADDDHVLLVTVHHIVSDGWSMGILDRELSALYAAFRMDEADPLPALAVQYADYAAWQRRWVSGEVLRRQAAYWTETLSGAPELLALPADRPRPMRQDLAGSAAGLELGDALSAALRALSRRNETTLFMTLLAGWAIVLGRLSGQDDVVIGTPMANRGRAEVEGLVGFFVNTLALRLDLSGSPTVAELLRRVKARALGAQQHQDIPFEQVVELVQPARSMAHSPLFQAMFTWQQHGPTEGLALPGLTQGTLPSEPNPPARFDLSMWMGESKGRIIGGVTYATALYDRETMERHLGYLRRVLEAMAADEHQGVDRLDLLSAAERGQVVAEWNRTSAEYPDACVHELFEAQAARTPDAVAVVFEGESSTYAEMDGRANQLAHHLRGLGVGPGGRVALGLERGVEMVVALLAVLKTGAAYVPLDPAYPEDRLRYMLEDSAPAVLLTHQALSGRFGEMGIPILALDRDAGAWAGMPRTSPGRGGVTPEHPAYVIYTSGSTGRPKGVINLHRGVVNLLWSMRETVRVEPADRMLAVTTLAFDIAVLELFLPLFSGARVEIVSRQTSADPALLQAVIAAGGATLMQATPATWRLLVEGGWPGAPGLRALCGGEALPMELAVRLRERVGALWNVYGPTETTIWSCVAPVEPVTGDRGAVPIGAPVANTRAYVVDARGEPVPVGVAGELWIGGAGVAAGYLNRPDATAERFVADAFSAEPGARLYRTGDLARWRADGTLEFLGRTDFQVKVRGFRIELGEIEARLAEHAGVRQAVVAAREDVPGDTRLVGYYVGDEAVDARELRAHLAERLPEHMLPAAFVRLEAMPLTPNGKVDRKALPAPEGGAFATRGYEAPLGEMEVALAGIWAELLGVDRVGRWDNYFELGGHSLRAVQLVSRVRQVLGVDAALGEVFDRPVLADLARVLERAVRAELPPIERVDRGAPLALSFAQQRLWFMERFGGLGSTYHIPSRLRLHGRLDRTALLGALGRIVARHEALRTVFHLVDGEPVQHVVPAEESRFSLVEHDLAGRAEPEAALRRLMAREAAAPFDLERGPLVRGRLVRVAEDDHVLLVTMHHVVSDGWSMGVFIRELAALYRAFLRGDPDPLPALAIQYADYAAWQRRWVSGDVLQQQAEYWTATLSGAPELLALPADHPRPAQQDFAGATVEVALDEALTAGLKALGRRNAATLFMTVLAGWAAVLSRLSGQADVVIGTPSANRGRAEIEGLIGFFINTLPVRVGLAGSPTVAGLLGRVKAAALGAQQHQDIPFEQVVELVQPARSLAHTPLFQAMFAWQAADAGAVELPGLTLGAVDGDSLGVAKFDLSLSLAERDGRIVGALAYATALFERETVERHLGYLRRVLGEMASGEHQPIDRLALLSDFERLQVVEGWNDTDVAYPVESSIHALFEAQVERRPDAVAVVAEGDALTYAELNAHANQLAHHLRTLGAGPDARVALCMERGVEMMVGLLGVLKAGAAYVPLDPSYPEDRLRHMLADSAPMALLTQDALAERFADAGIPVLALDGPAEAWKELPSTNPASGGLTPDHLAYVIYTSGSTGRPKGVMSHHRGAVNRLAWMQEAYRLDADEAVLQKTSFSFDVSVWEFFWPLMAGARLVMARPDGHKDPAYLVETVRDAGITTLHFVPSMLQLFLDHPDVESCAGLKRVVCSGEALPASLVRQFHARLPHVELHNLYGPTEAAVDVTAWQCRVEDDRSRIPIGGPIANTRVYVLDAVAEPVPVTVAGELHIGGVQVARGYLGRPALTAERFVPDPFSATPGARLYRTGDLARWLAEGTVEYLGRNDFQVKIRGFRIELGEIESRLAEHPSVREAVVIAREDAPGDTRLVGYYVADEAVDAQALRAHLAERLPEHMLPAAFVRLDSLPLTPNGKLDRTALPAPEGDAFAARGYEAPVGETEEALAEIWAEVLGVERVGRLDNFFELGGHSLRVVTLIERMRRRGMHAEVRALFTTPTLADLAAAVGGESADVRVPANGIGPDTTAITPEMLPLVALTQAEIDAVVAGVPGGAANLQDVYPLAPLQEGILFHHMLAGEGDPYLLQNLAAFDTRERLDAFLDALRAVIARHDVLRTAVVWEGMPEPLQVVWREAPLGVDEVELDAAEGDAPAALMARFDPRRHRIDVRQAPLMRAAAAWDAGHGRWLLLLRLHHLACDHTALEVLLGEVRTHLLGRQDELPSPLPFRNFVAQARLGVSQAEHEAFFGKMLGDVDEPTAPFGLLDVQGDGAGIGEARRAVDPDLAARLRERARKLGVSAASLCHVAWAQVLARVSGRDDVVFGTILFGRMQGGEGAHRVLGPFINTLPVRVRIGGEGVEASVRRTHVLLADLLRHEHASLALAQRCSGVEAPAPLFSALLNYRHGKGVGKPRPTEASGEEGRAGLHAEERTNYPVVLSVDDLGEA